MKRVFGLLLLTVLLGGCASGEYLVPKSQYQSKVQVLGVLPLLVDRSARIDYPHPEQLSDLLTRSAAGKYKVLVDRLRKEKGYFDVRALEGSPELLGMSLLSAPPTYDDLGRPQGLPLNTQAIAELVKQNVVDALLVVVFSEARIEETRRSRGLLESLKTRYSDVVATAAVVAGDGQLLWQMAGADTFEALPLQYPDFDEAYYNHTDVVAVKNITPAGIERILAEPQNGQAQDQLPEMYDELFARIVAGISPGLFDRLR